MKKMFIWGAVALVMLTLAGCPGDEATTKGDWKKGITDFEVQTGDSPGEIKYKFSATDPAAETYTLYYAIGPINDSLALIGAAIASENKKSVTPTPDFQTLSLTASIGYSFVVEAKKGTSDKATSAVKRATAKESETTPGTPNTPSGWLKGLTDFEVATGDNAGEIKYKFSATDPEADSYTLYYTQGSLNSALTIINAATLINQVKTVTPGNDFQALTGLIANTTYSLVVVAKKGANDDAKSGVKQIKAKENLPQLELTVTGIPTGTTIFAATLFDDTLLTLADNAVPLAVGLNLSGTCKFNKYDPNSLTQMGGAWTQTGPYYIVLSNDMKGTVTYIHTAGSQQPIPAKYDFTQATASISFNQFVQR
ncbi:MAG: hypothetical protein LBC52_07975 [Treponema sp.]|jgi:hypothetical protein|nr:hypothetical protein [Treponema sp.]